jgi:polygalacturonase
MALTKATYSMIEGASLNVLDFGAVGDGVTDDSVAIQAAINAIPAIGGEVYFPGGTYLVNTKIVLKSRLSLIGESRNNTLIKAGTVVMNLI